MRIMRKLGKNELAIFGGVPVRQDTIYYGKQQIDDTDIVAVTEVLKSDWLAQGPKIKQLENMLCERFGAKYAVTATSGTSALHLACIAADIQPGDEVITTPLTFSASANCVRYCGGDVIFADICADSLTIDPHEVSKKISGRTKAVIAVDYAGQPAQLKELKALCEDKGLILIEDAAHSLGSDYQGAPVGSIADLTTFSFHPVKTITGGEGGAVLCSNEKFSEKMHLAASHGIIKQPSHILTEHRDEMWYCEQQMLGFNYRMTDFQAALICSQAKKLTQFMKRRKQIVDTYNEAFSDLSGITLPRPYYHANPCWHLYVIRIEENTVGCSRKAFFDALVAENIHPQVHYFPVHLHPYYRSLGHYAGECPAAEYAYSQIMSLPLYPAMTDKDIDDVIEAVRKIYFYYNRKDDK